MISLVMATYNGGKFLREQLDSIYNQTLPPDEVIVVDDCSTDNTVEILEEYKQRYCLKYIINKVNMGVNKNFERAISLAQGDYICISDQDDVWLPTKIEVSFNKLIEIENNKPACVSSGRKDVSSDLRVLYPNMKYRHDGSWQDPLYRDSSQGCTLMFNKKLKNIILPLCPYFIYDAYIGTLACFVGNRHTIGEPLMYYRHHGNNVVAHSINKYHKGLTSAMSLYKIMRSRQKLYMLSYFKDNCSKFIVDSASMKLLDEAINYFSFKNDFQMCVNVCRNKHVTIIEKIYFIMFYFITLFNKKRQVNAFPSPYK